MRIKIILRVLSLVVLTAVLSGCHINSNAQKSGTEVGFTFSGSFVPAPTNTDTNNDGKPATIRTYEGASNLGNTTITILDEFAQPVPPVNCPAGNLEFTQVQGTFVIRVGNGDILLGVIESGMSCFDSVAKRSEAFEGGTFTGGTGQFADVTGPVEIRTSSIFLNTTAENGYASGGSTGNVKGTLELE